MTLPSDDVSSNARVTFSPIGLVRSSYTRRFGTPQQASAFDSDRAATLELFESRIAPEALTDLEGFERIWILSYLNRGGLWAPLVVPPRGPRKRRGLFATRSPDRPNPIGLSAVKLVRIEGLTLHLLGVDLLDQTPVLDIKPYVPYADAFADSKAGWIEDIPRDAPQIPRY